MIALFEAIPADGHAWRDAAGATAIGDDVRDPDETALGVIVVAADCGWAERRKKGLIQWEYRSCTF